MINLTDIHCTSAVNEISVYEQDEDGFTCNPVEKVGEVPYELRQRLLQYACNLIGEECPMYDVDDIRTVHIHTNDRDMLLHMRNYHVTICWEDRNQFIVYGIRLDADCRPTKHFRTEKKGAFIE